MIDYARTARGIARPATEEEIAKEDLRIYLASDLDFILVSDLGDIFVPNTDDFGYTHPNLHRRIETEPEIPNRSVKEYPFVNYDANGDAYKQSVVLGVWDGINSYRTTTTYTHDEESTTCEIP